MSVLIVEVGRLWVEVLVSSGVRTCCEFLIVVKVKLRRSKSIAFPLETQHWSVATALSLGKFPRDGGSVHPRNIRRAVLVRLGQRSLYLFDSQLPDWPFLIDAMLFVFFVPSKLKRDLNLLKLWEMSSKKNADDNPYNSEVLQKWKRENIYEDLDVRDLRGRMEQK